MRGLCLSLLLLKGPEFASRADARKALDARLRERDYRGPRAMVVEAG